MQRFKYLVVGIVCFLLGAALLQPAFGHYIASKNAHTLAKHHSSYFASRGWVGSYFSSKAWTKKYFYTKSQANSRYFTRAQADSRYINSTGAETLNGSLNVDDISVDNDITFTSPKIQNQVIPAAGFQANDETDDINRGTGNYVYSSSTLWAPVILPNQVTLTEIEFYYRDSDVGSDMSATIYRQALGTGAGGEFLATVTSSGSSGYSSTSTTTISTPVIDNNTYQYLIFISGSDADEWVQAIRLKYSFDTI